MVSFHSTQKKKNASRASLACAPAGVPALLSPGRQHSAHTPSSMRTCGARPPRAAQRAPRAASAPNPAPTNTGAGAANRCVGRRSVCLTECGEERKRRGRAWCWPRQRADSAPLVLPPLSLRPPLPHTCTPSSRLILMRHADSAEASPSAGIRDHGRPITPAGAAAAAVVARALAARGWVPDLIVASDSER